MIVGSDYLEINHDADRVTITIRESGKTVTAYLTVPKALAAKDMFDERITSAMAWRPPALIEYTGHLVP